MSWDGWQTFTHVQSKSAGMTFHENFTIPNSPKNDLVLLIIAIDIGKKVVCWRRKHISFPFLPLPWCSEPDKETETQEFLSITPPECGGSTVYFWSTGYSG